MEEHIRLKLMAFTMDVEAKNDRDQFPFLAIVTYGGVPSDSPAGGTDQIKGGPYKVLIPGDVLEEKATELKGKQIFAASSLDTHANSRSVGEFRQAWTDSEKGIVAHKASGILFHRRDPERVDKIVELARAGKMGMSFDMKDGTGEIVAHKGEKVLKLNNFRWRGATALKREAAAYEQTRLAAEAKQKQEEPEMEIQDVKNVVSAAMTEAFKSFKDDTLVPLTTELKDSIEKVVDDVEKLKLAGQKKTEKPDKVSDKDQNQKSETNKDPVSDPQTKVPMSQFMAGIGEQITSGLQPLADAIKENTDLLKKVTTESGEEELNLRKSLSAQEIEVLEKYGGGDKDDQKNFNTEQMRIAARAIAGDKTIPKATRENMVAELSRKRRAMERGLPV